MVAYRNYAKSHPDLCILAVNTFVQVELLAKIHLVMVCAGFRGFQSTGESIGDQNYGVYSC